MKKWYDEEYKFSIEVTGFLRGDHTEHLCRNGTEREGLRMPGRLRLLQNDSRKDQCGEFLQRQVLLGVR